MPIFRVSGGKLKKLSIVPLSKEKHLQQLVEANLMEALGLWLLASEYSTTFGGRIDTLAVDTNGAPVIIEYKRNKNDNVINQALSYLKWLKAQKREFFQMLMQQHLASAVAKNLVLDWTHPRVICIAESYSKFDIDTVEVVPLRVELYRYRYYVDDVFSLEPVIVNDQVPEPPATATEKADPQNYPTVEVLATKGAADIRALFNSFRERVLALDEAVVEKPTLNYVAFRAGKNFAEVFVGKNQIQVHLRAIDYDDPRKLVEKLPDGYNWTLNRRVKLNTSADLDYVLGLIEQSYADVI